MQEAEEELVTVETVLIPGSTITPYYLLKEVPVVVVGVQVLMEQWEMAV